MVINHKPGPKGTNHRRAANYKKRKASFTMARRVRLSEHEKLVKRLKYQIRKAKKENADYIEELELKNKKLQLQLKQARATIKRANAEREWLILGGIASD